MSSTATKVDERVVSMQFDNQNFEKNVQTSIGTIEKLKKSLNLSGAAKGLENIDTATKGVNMSPLSNAVESVGLKFSAMQVMATTALMNITNSAVNAGKRIVSALTIDPIKMGFSEYETQMNAVQTILANTESKGKTLDDVNGALDELNAYADKTIYNFTEMTRNIGTFTAAGVDLDTSVSAIKGIANLAAVSGSNSQQASTAMYQLSQALASGTVKLMDWNSVVNAGMGGQVFQDALKETARVHKVNIDEMIKKEGSFRETLQNGWLTSEILTETLSKFTGDLSEEQLKSMGYNDEQIKGILKMGQTANDAATKVKTFTQLLDTLKEAAQSGWTQTWEIIVGDFEEAKAMLTKVSDTIGEMIGSSAEARNEMLENWKVLGGRDDLIESIKNAFEGLMSIIKPIKEAFREIFPPMTGEKLAGFTEGLKKLTEKFTLSDTASDNLKRTFKGLFAVVDIIRQVFVAVVKAGASLFGTVGDLGGGILGITASMGDWLVSLAEAIRDSEIFNKVLQGVADIVKAALKGITAFAKFIKDKIVSPGMELFHALLERVSESMSGVGGVAGAMKDGVVKAFDAMSTALENCSFFKILSSLWTGIIKIGTAIAKVFGSLLSGFITKLSNGDFQGIIDFINGLISGGLGIALIKFVNSLREPFEGIGEIIENLGGCLEGFQQRLKAEALQKIATAIAILSAALLVLSLIDADKLDDSILAISTLFTELLVAMSIVTKLTKQKGLFTITTALVTISTAMLLLAAAMKIMSTMSWDEMIVGLTAVAGGLGALLIAVNLLPESKVNKAAKAIRTMSTALLILSLALKIMGTMSWSELAVGLVAMAGGLVALVAAVNLLPKDTALKTLGLMSLATALVVLAGALKIMATMSWGDVAVSLVTLAGSLTILVVALKLMTSALPGALVMLIIAPALLILAGVMKIMSTLSWSELAVGLVALAGSLIILAVAMTAMMTALPGALAMLIIAPALLALATTLVILGALSWESIIKGLVSLAGAFAVIGIAGLVLGPIVPIILALSTAIILMGTGILAAGVGLMAFGAGLTALSVGFTAFTASLSVVVTGIIALVSAIVTGIISGIGKGIITLCDTIANSASSICNAFKSVIIALCDALIASIPSLIKCIHTMLTALLEFIVSFVPELVDAGMRLIIGLLNGIAQRIPEVIDAGVNVIISFIEGITSAVPKLVDAAFQAMIDLLNGLAEALRTNTPILIDAVNNLMSAAIEAVGAFFGNFVEVGKMIIQGLIKGVKNAASSLWNAIVGVVKDAWNGVLDFLGIKSPSRLAAEAGMYVDEGLAVGLAKYADVAKDAATDVGEETIDSLGNAIGKVADVIDSDMDMQPTIRPVLDLSEVKDGANSINDMLGEGTSIDVSANVGAANSISNRQNGGNEDIISALNKLRDDLKNVGNTTYVVEGITYDDDNNVTEAIKTIVRAAKIERRA